MRGHTWLFLSTELYHVYILSTKEVSHKIAEHSVIAHLVRYSSESDKRRQGLRIMEYLCMCVCVCVCMNVCMYECVVCYRL